MSEKLEVNQPLGGKEIPRPGSRLGTLIRPYSMWNRISPFDCMQIARTGSVAITAFSLRRLVRIFEAARKQVCLFVVLMACQALLLQPVAAVDKNSFDLSDVSIPVSEILAGGPPRDGIPAIDHPVFSTVENTDWLEDDDLLLTVSIDGDDRAYPIRILLWHEIVNDTVGGQPLTVTFCPLCGTGMVFSRQFADQTLDFGVSGLLYQSDVLMYDRQSESLWSQLAMRAVSGPMQGQAMQWLSAEHISWAAWRQKYPNGKVLTQDTGAQRNYARNPYQGYEQRDEPLFPVPAHREELPRMEKVLAVVIDGEAKAWPLAQLSDKPLQDTVAGQAVHVSYNAAQQRPQVLDAAGESLPHVVVFWFAWQAFYPESALWLAGQ